MEEALRAKLLGTAALAALVGTRVDWGVRSQGATLPAVTLHQVSGLPQMKLLGPADWSQDRVQIDCWGRTFIAARNLANIIGGPAGALNGFRGDLPGVRLRTFVIGRRSDEESDSAGPVFRTQLDIMAWHTPL